MCFIDSNYNKINTSGVYETAGKTFNFQYSNPLIHISYVTFHQISIRHYLAKL